VTDRFDPAQLAGVYRAIHERRDIRSYRPDPIPDELLWKLLNAAHHAGSVGYMQPWNFLIVRDPAQRRRVYEHFLAVNQKAAEGYDGERGAAYRSLKLQGLLDAPLNLLITCDTTRGGRVLGRATIPETDVYSTCLAAQNFWLAARAEGVGVGWMSLMEPQVVAEIFHLPEGVHPVVYFTVGYPVEFPPEPMLETVGWGTRLPLTDLVFENRWNQAAQPPATQPIPPKPTAPLKTTGPLQPNQAVKLAQTRLDNLTKPQGSLGRLEELACRLAAIQGLEYPTCQTPHGIIFAADHGVTAQGVSAYQPQATHQMVYQFLAGGAVINELARLQGMSLTIVDVGVDHDFGMATGLTHSKVRRSSRDLTQEPAMTEQETRQAWAAGVQAVDNLPTVDLLVLGEMGIGNSTAAAALVAALLGLSPEQAVGQGTGIGPETLTRKAKAVATALARHGSHLQDPWQALVRVGGYDLAALAGAMTQAHHRRIPVMLDGFIAGAAALVACRIAPPVGNSLLAGHRSTEPAHGAVLKALGLEPLLDLHLRLGEGSGAALAVGLARAACQILSGVRTYEETGLPRPISPEGIK